MPLLGLSSSARAIRLFQSPRTYIHLSGLLVAQLAGIAWQRCYDGIAATALLALASLAPIARMHLAPSPNRRYSAALRVSCFHGSSWAGALRAVAAMAGFHTHITVSTACGIAYGSGAAFGYDVDPFAAVLGGGLCSLSGMLPDLDSDSGTPLREAVLFCSAVVPMMLLPRFQQAHLSHEMMILATAGVYAFIRFGLAGVMRKLTVHRGMFHSIPALLIAAEATFLLVGTGPPSERYFMAGGVALGFFSHLLLDEIWSVETKFGRVRLKSSFGTALKFWGDQWWPNLVTYGICGALTLAVVNDPRFAPPPIDVGHITNQIAGAIDEARDVVNDARGAINDARGAINDARGAGEQQQQKRDRWRDSPETVDRQAAHEEDFATRFWNSRRDGRSMDDRSPDDRLPAEPAPRAMQRDLEPRESPLSRYESPPRATIRARR